MSFEHRTSNIEHRSGKKFQVVIIQLAVKRED
jgi:hypothetical protein